MSADAWMLSDDRKVLWPFDPREAISLKRAAALAKKSEGTVRGWCIEHAIGRRVGGGTWQVSCVALAMFLDGNEAALAAYHRDNRLGPHVATYFARLGLSDLLELAPPQS